MMSNIQDSPINKAKDNKHIAWIFGLMILFTAMRWPSLLPWNFSPVYAICFCAGVYFKGVRLWLAPVALMFVSDVAMNYFYWRPQGFSIFNGYMLANYVLCLGLVGLGYVITSRRSPTMLIAGGALGACAFFFASNLMAWLGNPIYAKTWAGLVQSFTVGQIGFPPPIVFLKNSALSGALFTAIIVCSASYVREKKLSCVKNNEKVLESPN